MTQTAAFANFIEYDPSEETCAFALFSAKWPKGFRCPRCNHSRSTVIRSRILPLYQCRSCHHQTSLLVGTIFEKSRTPLTKWFKAIYLHLQSDGINALQTSRILEVTYKTAWLMCHKIRYAMSASEGKSRLNGLVKINLDKYARNFYSGYLVQPQLQPVVIGGSFDASGSPSKIKIKLQEKHVYYNRMSAAGVSDFLENYVDEQAQAKIKSLVRLRPINSTRDLSLHKILQEAAEWIRDRFRGISSKHLQAYLDQYCVWRNSQNTLISESFAQLLYYCVQTSVITYAALINKPTSDTFVPIRFRKRTA